MVSHGVPSPQSWVWHGCSHGDSFWRLVTCVESWVEQQKTYNQNNNNNKLTQALWTFWHEIVKIRLWWWLTLYFNGFLRFLEPESRDFASIWNLLTWVGLGTCDLGLALSPNSMLSTIEITHIDLKWHETMCELALILPLLTYPII